MKLNFLYLIVFLIFVISVFNLYYKPSVLYLFRPKTSKFLNFPIPLQSDEKLFCSITGYKCENEGCDCSTLCKGKYEKFTVHPNDHIVMFSEKLVVGTYCLPQGLTICHLQHSIPVYSMSGWICVSKNPEIFQNNHMIACQNPYSEDNSLNQLIDMKTNQVVTPTDIVQNYYEIFNDGFRYKCHCGSLDKSGKPLIALEAIPFQCASDYCLEKLHYWRNVPGFNSITKECDCGQYKHEDSSDRTSPCVQDAFKMKDFNLLSIVHCTLPHSLKKRALYCNESNSLGIMSFTKKVEFSKKPLLYIEHSF